MAQQLTTAASIPARRDRVVALLPFAILAAWSLLVTVLLARYGLDNHYVFRDEANEILLGRAIADDVSRAITEDVARGPERLTALFAAAAVLVSDSPARQVDLLHLSSALSQGLVTVPVWLAGRVLGLSRWQALAPATIASAGSFAFYGVLTLPTSVAVLSASLMLWAMLRALRRPGASADLLVVATLALTVLARIGWAPLVVALVPATLAACWFDRPRGERIGAWLRRLPGRLLRRHPLLTPLAAVVLLVALAAGPSLLLGGEAYGGVRLKAHIVGSVVWDNTLVLGAHLAIGTALVPFVLALPVIARGLVRPTDPLEGGFAWMLLGFLLIFSWAYYASMNEDRYFAVLAPPLILAGALAVFRRPPPLWSVALSGVLVTALVVDRYAWPATDVFVHFVAPTSQFFVDLPIGKLQLLLPDDHAFLAGVTAGVAAVAALVAVVLARHGVHGRAAAVVAGVLIVGMLAYQLAATRHSAKHFTAGVGMPALTTEQLEFVDRAAGDGHVRPLAVNAVVDPDLRAQLQFVQSYNDSVGVAPFDVRVGAPLALPGASARLDWRSGRVRVRVKQQPPELLLQMTGAAPLVLAGERLSPSPVFPWAQLVRLEQPLRARWAIRGAQPDRFPLAGDPIEVRVFENDASYCLSGEIVAHPFQDDPVRYRLTDGTTVQRGVVRPLEPRQFKLRLERPGPLTVRLTGEPGLGTDGVERGPTLSTLDVGPCRTR